MRFKYIGASLALGIELAGIALVTVCSFVAPPFTSATQGPARDIQWGPECSGCPADYFVSVNDSSFDLERQIQPAGPGPYDGQTVLVTYQDLARGRSVLSLTTSPGGPISVTYSTPDYTHYMQARFLGYLAAIGIVAGALLTGAGAALLFLVGRRSGTPAGGLSAALAPLCLLGGVALVSGAASLPGAAITLQITIALWLVSTVAVLISGVISRGIHERPAAFASRAMLSAGAAGALWSVWWIGVIIHWLRTIS